MSVSLQKYVNSFFKELLDDSDINEIAYNGDDKLWYQNTKGIWEYTASGRLDFEGASAFAQASAAFKDDKIDNTKPILSCILTTGERVQIVMPSATKKDHISITIRKPSTKRYTTKDYKDMGFFNHIVHENEKQITPRDKELLHHYHNNEWESFITKAVSYGKNVVISGGTGSGKTTFMKTLIDYISTDDRIITIEDVEEIVFYEHKNFVQLFYPSEAKEGDPITSATLLKSCLRMKPDRILLAELRGAETYNFINVLSSGHGGSITSCHAGSTQETFKRLALMCLQNKQGQCVPFEILQNNLRDLIDVVVHVVAHGGKRHISDVYFKGAYNE
ncbi:P-type DNA transfer ATPase VirB11 [Helicobacter trogontum]|uniref:P-type DNA transfer ATPase VirB11 n=1 Tax=Helicobacter trogontum TaxID=50960 RepID=A0A4U8S3M1_9HELI|nr:P-type DNA transfer ATPase VirB11 [Helicobacter trogontum]TLD80364.1 P-type DNA transfer ATPase VirB11 [Helicobacter trogontum]